MNLKILYIIGAVLLLLPLVLSIETLGTFKQNTNIELLQSCSNCSYINISSVIYPNSTQCLSMVEMTKTGTQYNYTSNCSNALGNYIVNGFGDVDGTTTVWAYDYLITPNGEESDISKALIQFGLLAFLILFLVISIIGIFNVDNYIGRFALYWVSHVLIIAITFISWQMSNDYLTGTPMITGIFKIGFYFFMISAFPMVILSLAWIFYIHTMNDTIKGFMNRGMDEDEAYSRAGGKKGW